MNEWTIVDKHEISFEEKNRIAQMAICLIVENNSIRIGFWRNNKSALQMHTSQK
jgi:DeoR/GlpR family transcriptional regulator of sugar metabolism